MFLAKILNRALYLGTRSNGSFYSTTAAAATATSAKTSHNPLEEFFEVQRSQEEDKPNIYGRSWKASELRLKSWDDLQKLWYVLLKEKNMLMTQRQMLNAQNLRFPNPERIPKVFVVAVYTTVTTMSKNTECIAVRKSMCRIKHVLTEKAIEEADPRRSAEMKKMINAL